MFSILKNQLTSITLKKPLLIKDLLFFTLLFLFLSHDIQANTYTVTTNANSGAGSLRQAIIDANGVAGPHTINLNASLGTITLLSSLPQITQSVTFNGNGRVIDGNKAGGINANVFIVGNGATSNTVTINNLTIQNARARGGNGTNGGGGGFGAGAAIFVHNLATATVSNVNFTNNEAVGGTGGNFPVGGTGGGLSGATGDRGNAGTGGAGGASCLGTAGGSPGGTAGSLGASGGNASTANFGAGGGAGGGGGPGQEGVVINPLPPSNASSGGAGGRGGSGGFGGGGGGSGSGGGGGGGVDPVAHSPGASGGGGGSGVTSGPAQASGGVGGGTGGRGAAPVGTTGLGQPGVNGGSGGAGGGGAGLGASIFVQAGGTLNIQGGITESGGVVTAGAPGTSPAGGLAGGNGAAVGTALFIQDGSTINFNPAISETTTINGTIADDSNASLPGGTYTAGSSVAGFGGAITKTGAGTLILNGANTYKDGTTISAGILRITNNNNLGATTGTVTFSGGTLQTTGTLTVNRTTTLNSGGGTLDPQAGNLTYSGVISGTGTLTKVGTGALTLSGVNTYSGGTNLNEGTIFIGADSGLGNTSGALTFDGGTLRNTAAFTITRAAILNAGGGTLSPFSGNLVYSGNISGVGGLTKASSPTVTLSGTNTYTGSTTINAGTLAAGATTALPAATAVTLANTAGAILDISSAGGGVTIGSLAGGGATGGNVILGANTLTVGNASNTTYAGILSGTGGLTKQGSGTLTLNSVNTYTGGTTINAGTVQLGVANAIQGRVTSGTGAANTLDLAGYDLTLTTLNGGSGTYGIITSSSGTPTLTMNCTGGDSHWNGIISGPVAVNYTGPSRLIYNNQNTFTGGTTIGSSAFMIQVNTTNAFTGLLTFPATGSPVVAFTGGGVLNLKGLSGGSSSTGLNNTSAFSPGTMAITLNDDAPNNYTYSGYISNDISIIKQGTNTVTFTNGSGYTAGTTIAGGTMAIGHNGALGSGSITFNGTSSTLRTEAALSGVTNAVVLTSDGIINTNTFNSTFSGVFSGSGNLIKSSTGTLTLSNASTYTGTTTISGGTLALSGSGSIAFSNEIILSGGTFDIGAVTTSATINDLSGTSGTVALGTKALTFGTATASKTFGGVLSGTGSITKQGSGTTVLTGTTSSVGPVTVSAGTLSFAQASGSFTATTYTNNATTSLTNPANLALSTFAQSGTGTLNIDYANNSASITATNTTLSGTLTLSNFSNGTLPASSSLLTQKTLLSSTNNISGDFTTVPSLATAVDYILGSTGKSADSKSYLAGLLLTWNTAPSLANGTFTLTNPGDTFNVDSILADKTGPFTSGWNGTSLTKAGAGTLILSAANTYTGNTTISAGTLQIGNGGTTGSVAGNIINNSTLIFNRSNNLIYSNIISGTGSVTKQGAGTLTLSGANTYSGATAINTGTLAAGSTSAFPVATAMTVANTAGAILDIAGAGGGVTIGSLAGGGATGGNVTLGANTLTVGNAANTTYAGVLSGTGGLTKQGSGILTLSGANTYSGATAINAGTLAAGSTSALPTATAVTLANTAGTSLDIAGGGGGVTIGLLTGGGATGGNVTLGANTLTVGNAANTTYGGVVSGTGGLTKQGSGTLTLSGANTYSGATAINAGTLAAGSTSALPTATTVTLANTAGTSLDIAGAGGGVTIGSLAGGGATGGNVTLGANTLTVGNAANTAYAGIISGTGGLTKQGSGTLTLSGANTYSGATAINAGTLAAGSTSALPSATTVTLANTAGTSLDIAGAGGGVTIGSLAGGGATGGNVALGANTLTVGNAANTTYAGILSGTGSLTKQGSGTLTLSGANTYSGATVINAGTIVAGSTTALPSATAVTLANTAGVGLDISGAGGGVTIGSLAGGGATGGNVTLGANTLTVGNAANTTYGGVVSGTGGLTKQGSGILTLSGANTYSGATAINAGTLAAGSTSALPAATAVTLANTTGASLDIAGAGGGVTIGSLAGGGATGGNVTLGANTLTVGNATNTAYAGIISGTGGLTKQGSGTLTLSGTNIYSGATAINAGAISINADTRLGTGNITLNTGTLQTTATFSTSKNITLAGAGILNVANTTSLTVSGTITGAFSLTKASAGSLILTGAAAPSATTISAGTLQVGNGGTTGSLSGNITNNGNLIFNRSNNLTYSDIVSGPGALTQAGSGILTLDGANTYTGATNVTAGTLALGASGSLVNTSGVILSAGTTFDVSNKTTPSIVNVTAPATSNIRIGAQTLILSSGTVNGNILDGGISGATGGVITKTTVGTLILNGTNTYSGGTNFNAGTITVNNNDSLGTGVMTVGGAGTLQTAAAVTLANAITLNSPLTVDSNGFNSTLSGDVSGTSSLIKQGSGTLTLSGANTYSGATVINVGTLAAGSTSALPAATTVTLANTAGTSLDIAGAGGGVIIGSLAGGGATGGNVTLGANTLTVGNASNTTYAGVLSGTGGLTKQGSGTTVLTGTTSSVGPVTVSAGALSFAQASGSFTATTYTNNATTSLTSPANLALTTFTQAGTGTLNIDYANNSASITATNTTLAGTLTVSNFSNGTLPASSSLLTQKTLITSTNNISGDFTTVPSLTTAVDYILGSTGKSVDSKSYLAGLFLTWNAATSVANGTFTLTNPGDTFNVDTILTDKTGPFTSGWDGTSLTKAGAGTLTLSAANTYTGNTTISAGSLQIGNGGTTGSVAGNITNNGTLIFNRSNSFIYSNIISGTGNVTKQGAGTLTLSGANTYSGATAINAGTLAAGSTSALPSATAVTLANTAGTSLDITGAGGGVTIGSLAGGGATGGNVALGTNTLTVGNAANTTYAGVLSGTGGLTKQGSGTLTLSGANTYSGATVINAGTIVAGSTTALPSATAVTLANTAGVGLDISGAGGGVTIGSLAGGGATGGNVTLGANTLTVGNAANTTYGGVVSGTGGLTKQGSGILTLSGANTYSGATAINAGTLAAGSTSALPAATAVTLANTTGASLDIAGAGGGVTIGSLAGGGATGGNVTLGANTLTVGNAANTTYAGIISGTGGVTKQGTGTLTLSGVNTYSGATAINAGAISIDADTRLGTGNITLNTGTLQTTATFSTSKNITLTGAGTLNVANTTSLTVSGTVTGAFSLTKASAGTLILTGAAAPSATTISGTLQVGNGGTTGSLSGNIANNGNLIFNRSNNLTYSDVVSGPGALTQAGSGILTLDGANTYTGNTTVRGGGSVQISSDNHLGTGNLTLGDALTTGRLITAAPFTFTKNITLAAGGGIIDAVNNSITLTGSMIGVGSFEKQGLGKVTITTNPSYSGSTILSDGILEFNAATDGLTGNTINNGDLIFNPGGTSSYSGIISGNGNIIKNGTGSQSLLGANSFIGNIEIEEGVLEISDDTSLGNVSNSVLFSINPGTLKINNPTTLSSTRNIVLNSNATIHNDHAVSIDSVISGAGSLTKTGAGTLSLSSNNTYTGLTIVNGGTLRGDIPDIIQSGLLIQNGTLDLNGNNQGLIMNLSGSAGATINLASASLSITNTADSTFSGIISGSGSLIKNGPRKLSLAGVNTFSGPTTVNTGALEFAADTTNLISDITIAPGASLIFNQTSDSLYGRSISGGGAIIKNGSNQLEIPSAGVWSHNGATTVMNGELKVNGAVTTSSVTVNGGARISGSGSVYDLFNSGIVTPGNSIGTLNVNHDLVLNSTSSYECEVNASGQSDLIQVNGTSTINGNLSVVAGMGQYTPTTVYTILTSTGGRTGTFSSQTVFPANLTLNVIYNPTNIQITLNGSSSFAELAPNGNPGQVARYLDTLMTTLSPSLSPLLNALSNLTGNELYQSLNKLHSASNILIRERIVANGMEQSDLLLTTLSFKRFIDQFKKDNQDIDLSFLNDVKHPQAAIQSLHHKTDSKEKRGTNFNEINQLPQNRVLPSSLHTKMGNASVWMQTHGDKYNAKDIPDTSPVTTSGLSSTSWGHHIGADYSFSESFILGVLSGYDRTNYTLHNASGKGEITTLRLGVYGTWAIDNHWHLNGGLFYANHHIEGQRSVNFPGFTDSARYDRYAHELNGLIETGYDFPVFGMIITPHLGGGALCMHEKKYAEISQNKSALIIKSQTSDFIQGKVGGQLSKVKRILGADVFGYLKVSYIHKRSLGGIPTLKAGLVAGQGSFNVFVANKTNNSFNSTAGVTVSFSNNIYVNVLYQQQSSKNQKNQEGLIQVGWRF